MKSFFTSMLGTIAGLFVFCLCALIVLVGVFSVIAAVAAKHGTQWDRPQRAVEPNSYLVVDLGANLTDSPPPFDFSGWDDDQRETTLQLRTAIRAIAEASRDSRIKGLLIEGSADPRGLGSGFPALRELRTAIFGFRASGKPTWAYLESAGLRDYYVASAAGTVDLSPYGMIVMPGLAVIPTFYAGALQKYGIGVQVTRVGKYKSFVEPFTRTSMSPEDREQTQMLLDQLWTSLLVDIGRARQIAPGKLRELADSEGEFQPDAAKKDGLVDRLAYRDELLEALRKESGLTDEKQPHLIGIGNYAHLALPRYSGALPSIAIVYAEGDIVDGEGGSIEVGGDRFAREIRQLRQDDSVKAIVLRVNSPGGSVTASEEIGRELDLARQAKPVIVSMGSYAASGGYWISAGANRIFADPTTVTGSIGIFGISFDVQKLASDWGVTFDSVKTGKFAGFQTITRPQTPEEMAIRQRIIDGDYGLFIDRVASGRHLPVAEVEDIAQGRVWSGLAARRLGLVDAIGGLPAAVYDAAHTARLARFQVVEYPKPKDLAQTLADMFGQLGSDGDSKIARPGPLGEFARLWRNELSYLKVFDDPKGAYAILPVRLSPD